MLLAYGANVNEKDNVSTTYNIILCYAAQSSVMIVIFLFYLFGQNEWAALYAASCEGHIKIVEILLAYGANVNDKNDVSTMLNLMM